MKKLFTLTMFALIGTVSFSQILWDDFDSPSDIVYSFTDGVLNQSFSNAVSDTVNPSDTCARYARNGAVLYDVIVIQPSGKVEDLSSYKDSTLKMSMKVWSSSVGDTIQITLEDNALALPANYPTGRHSEYRAITTVSNAWEQLEFTLINIPDASMTDTTCNQMVILFAPGTNSSNIYLFDDLMGPFYGNPCDSVSMDITILEDFECQRNISYDFINGDNVVRANPVMDGTNGSDKCGKITKWVDPDLNDSINVPHDGAFGGVLVNPFSTAQYKTAHISLYDPSAPQDFILILRDASENTLAEKTFTTSNASGWEEYKIDLSAVPTTTNIEGWVMVFNPGTNTADSIYYDNFKISNDFVPIEDAISNSINEVDIKIFPNPVRDIINIVSDDYNVVSIKIINSLGKIVDNVIVDSRSIEYDASNLVPGSYIISLSMKNGVIKHEKIIK